MKKNIENKNIENNNIEKFARGRAASRTADKSKLGVPAIIGIVLGVLCGIPILLGVIGNIYDTIKKKK